MADMQVEVAVLGSGPTGLAVANILGQAGVRVALVERNPSTVQEPRAVSVDDESLRTMQATGLVDEVLADVAQDYGSYYYSAKGRRFLAVAPTSRDYGFPKRNAFSQPVLEATLKRGLSRFSNVAQLYSHECQEISETEKQVVLRLGRSDGAGMTLKADYLVAADGGRSMARKHVGAEFEGSTYKQRWLIVDLAATCERLRQTRIICDPARPLISLPGPKGIRRYEFLLHDHEDDAGATDEGRIRAMLAQYGPDKDAPIVRKQVYAFHARIADRWNTPRVFLAGDAAHLSPPFAGQGMNSGMRDAHNIAWKLAEVVRGRIGPGLLATYQAERKPHATALIQMAVRSGGVMVPRSRAHAWAVQTGFRLAGLIPSLQSYFAQMKYKPKPHYQQGFLMPSASPLVGRMLHQPQMECTEGQVRALDDVLGHRLRLVAFGPEAQTALTGWQEADFGIDLGQPLAILPSIWLPDRESASGAEVVRDRDGMLNVILPADRTTLLVVRPDRYIAAVSSDLAEIAAAVKSLARNCL